MIDLIEIYVHWFAGRSQAQIADSLGIDRKTGAVRALPQPTRPARSRWPGGYPCPGATGQRHAVDMGWRGSHRRPRQY